MLDYFYIAKDKNNYIYSLDMIRLNFELLTKEKSYLDDFYSFIEKFSYCCGVTVNRYITKTGLNYHYLYNITIELDNNKCSFVIGTGLLCKKENEHKGFIEFNPNKCYKFTLFVIFFNDLKKLCYSMTLKRYDLAIDLPIKRDLLKLISSSKCNYQSFLCTIIEGSIVNSSRTEYQGIRNHNKFCKLYDKTKESKLNYDLTRIEFTFDPDETEYKNLPNFLYYYVSDNNNGLLNLLVQLLCENDNLNMYLKKLDYRQRKKVKELLKSRYIELDISCFNDIRTFALSYNF